MTNLANLHKISLRFRFPLAIVFLGLLCSDSHAQDWWQRSIETRTKYYNLKTDLPEEQAIEIANHMDFTFESYANLFSGLKLRRIAKLDVYIFATQEDYMAILKRKFNSDGAGSQGQCITRGDTISLVGWKGRTSMKRLKSLVQHEGFHQFASNFFPRLPRWCNEGLAEVFERGVLIDGKIVLGEVSVRDIRSLQSAKNNGKFKTIGGILTVPASVWGQEVRSGSAGANYLQAWNVCHCFLFSNDSQYQGQFLEFLKGINQGSEWKASFVQAFGVPNLDAMNEVWLEYISTLSPVDYRTTIRHMEFLSMAYMESREKEADIRDFDQLMDWISENRFEFESELFGEKVKLSDADGKVFKIPFAEISRPQPVFELVDSKGRLPKTSKPLPKNKLLGIRTQGLKPYDFIVSWTRDRKQESGYRPVFDLVAASAKKKAKKKKKARTKKEE